ncbi:mRNA capping enzyme [Pleurotus eryngii]|uniref:mRNA-capping enzyme subunit alpha n=1 Tax=Pleurotus eryngii TaxID=5323 RepID=A0A9P6A774_PLEER|nr:mRNA capping enzyme [Pleurotus eryngii]
MSHVPRVPELPGNQVPRHSEQEIWLKRHVARLCQLDHDRFPGSQPVSFGMRDLMKLERQDYWVCEKSDGVRVLMLIQTDLQTGDQMVYLIDRHNSYRQLNGLYFPHFEDPRKPLRDTLVDGELVLDYDPQTRQETLRLLAFDCLVVNEQNVMSKTLDKRYGRLQEWFYKPYAKMMKDHPHMAASQPFQIKVKEINFSYSVEKVFALDIPALQHGNDGLIYTCVNAPYSPGTDTNILKWKPPSENSIDFKLVLRFPPLPADSQQPDFCAKPIFALHVWCGGDRRAANYELYDTMHVEDDEWEKMKMSGEQIDDRIVEVHWDAHSSHWRMMRFRDDKPQGNHRTVVENIIQTIIDGVEKESLLARSNAIRSAWKARLGQPSQPQPQPAANQPPASRPPDKQNQRPAPHLELRYGPLQTSRYSKVSGPQTIAGMQR